MTLRQERPASRGLFRQFVGDEETEATGEHHEAFPRRPEGDGQRAPRRQSRGKIFWMIARDNVKRMSTSMLSPQDAQSQDPSAPAVFIGQGRSDRDASPRSRRVKTARSGRVSSARTITDRPVVIDSLMPGGPEYVSY